MASEPQLTSPTPLTDERGRLRAAARGWSPQPLIDPAIPGRWGRRKRWNYWNIRCGDRFFVVALADVDYLGVPFVQLIDAGRGEIAEGRRALPLARGLRLGDGPADGAELDAHRTHVRFHRTGPELAIDVDWPNLEGRRLEAHFRITYPPGHETLNVVIPWDERRFQFTAKENALPASGWVRWGGEEIVFPADGSFAVRDFGRGVWPYQTTWNWATASGRDGAGRTVGLNLGAKWTDGTGMTENAFLLDGRIHKLGEDVRFAYDGGRPRAPWTIRSADRRRVDLTFEPALNHCHRLNLGLLRFRLDHVVGRFFGHLDDGSERLELDGLWGSAEEQFARW